MQFTVLVDGWVSERFYDEDWRDALFGFCKLECLAPREFCCQYFFLTKKEKLDVDRKASFNETWCNMQWKIILLTMGMGPGC